MYALKKQPVAKKKFLLVGRSSMLNVVAERLGENPSYQFFNPIEFMHFDQISDLLEDPDLIDEAKGIAIGYNLDSQSCVNSIRTLSPRLRQLSIFLVSIKSEDDERIFMHSRRSRFKPIHSIDQAWKLIRDALFRRKQVAI